MPMLVSEDANKMCFMQISADNSTVMLGNDRELSFDSIPDALKVHGAVYELVETPSSFLPQSQNGSEVENVWQLSISYLPRPHPKKKAETDTLPPLCRRWRPSISPYWTASGGPPTPQ